MTSFQKIVATGNDFLFIDARRGLSSELAGVARSEIARKLCDLHFGAGADGLVFVENASTQGRLKWDFYNNDGSTAEMCGNASRCMGRWAARNLGVSSIEFETQPGLVRADMTGDEVVSHLDYLSVEFSELEYQVGGKTKKAAFVNTGVPHAVVEVTHIALANTLTDDIRALRRHPQAGERGTNVTFLQKISAMSSGMKFSTVTFERGVENFTLSCGTGVLAAAAVGLKDSGSFETDVSTPGGELNVKFGPGWQGAQLKGPALYIYEGKLSEEFVKWLKR